MKKLYYFLLFACTMAQAQVINIPDANFKSKLIALGIDTNANGEIEQTEALAVQTYLSVDSSNISSLEGVQYFTNVQYLTCTGNDITELDVTALTNLRTLDCYNNEITTLHANGLTNLTQFMCSNNQLTQIDLSGLTSLYRFECNNNLLTNLDLSGLPLITLYCSFNPLGAIDLTGLSNLEYFGCQGTQLSALNLQPVPNLTSLNCGDNNLTSIDLSPVPNLYSLDCFNNQLTTLDLSNMTELDRLNCDNNQIASLDFSGMRARGVYISNNFFTVLDTDGLQNCEYFGCEGNQFVTLDFSSMPKLFNVNVHNNPLLTSVNIKNGNTSADSLFMWFADCPNLQYICADDQQEDLVRIQNWIAENNYTQQCTVNSYCSFTVGGVYNTIEGTALFDADNDGCDANDIVVTNIRIGIADGTNSGATYTSDSGYYSFFVQRPNLTLTPSIENPTYFNISPTTTSVSFPSNNSLTETRDFCITTNGVHSDVELVLIPLTNLRPGFDSSYKLVYHNKGNQILNGTVSFNFETDRLQLLTANPTAASQDIGLLTWNYQNLLPFESREIEIRLHVNAPTDVPAVNGGDVFSFSASIEPIAGDETPDDNLSALQQTAVNSFDPNDKVCLEGAIVNPDQIGKYLHYVINFENTGTAAAQNIVVKDLIDTTKYDIGSLQVLDASHTLVTRVNGNKVEFFFENIGLEPNAHGHVAFKIKTKSTLAIGDSVSNQADIYFDYNFPIVTDPAVTVFSVLARSEFATDDSVSIMPNPATDLVTVKANSKIQSITLFDVQGRNLSTKLTSATQTTLDIAQYPKGIYFLKVTTDKGSRVEKLIRK